MNHDQTLPDFIRARRERLGISERKFAKAMDWSQGLQKDIEGKRWRKYEKGDSGLYNPIKIRPLENIQKLHDALGLSTDAGLSQSFWLHAWNYCHAADAVHACGKQVLGRLEEGYNGDTTAGAGRIAYQQALDKARTVIRERIEATGIEPPAPDLAAYAEWIGVHAPPAPEKVCRINPDLEEPDLADDSLTIGEFIRAVRKSEKIKHGRNLNDIIPKSALLALEGRYEETEGVGHEDGKVGKGRTPYPVALFKKNRLKGIFDYLKQGDPQGEIFTPYQQARYWCLAENYVTTVLKLEPGEGNPRQLEEKKALATKSLEKTIRPAMERLVKHAKQPACDMLARVAEDCDNDSLRDLLSPDTHKPATKALSSAVTNGRVAYKGRWVE